MASCQTKEWVASAPVAKLTVTIESQTGGKAVLAWKVQYIAKSPANSVDRTFTAKIDGDTVYNKSYSINGKTGTYTVASGTKPITKKTTSQDIAFSISVPWQLTWSGSYAGTLSASSKEGDLTVSAKTKYTVSYNANGGSGAPSSQTKWYGTNLTLSSTKPERDGYTFQGWATSSGGSVAYAVGATYSANASVTLYAVWKANTYTVSYNANGGTGAPSSQTKTYGVTLTLSSTKPTRTGHTFKGWATTSGGSAAYQPSGKYTANSAVTLYAVWDVNTYTISYNVNGGESDPPADQTKTYGTTLTLRTTVPTRTNYNFKGWATSTNATTATYQPGGSYTSNSAATLYAVWELAYVKPKISNLTIKRVNESEVNEGYSNAEVSFSWETTLYEATSIKIVWWDSQSSASITLEPEYLTGKSGTVTAAFGYDSLSLDVTYTVSVEVYDSNDKNTATITLPSNAYIIDFRYNGKGVAIGKAAENDGFDIGWDTTTKNLAVDGTLDISGNANVNGNIVMRNADNIYMKNASGTNRNALHMNSSNHLNLGYGGYKAAEGITNIYGDKLQLISNNGVFANGMSLATNKVLYSHSGYYMNENHTITLTLSDAVSKQANGIVLVWTRYTNGASEDTYFNYVYIPKFHVANHPGCGISMMLSATPRDTHRIGVKYIYVGDTTITGYSGNDDAISNTDSGINIHGNSFVLRYVLGV